MITRVERGLRIHMGSVYAKPVYEYKKQIMSLHNHCIGDGPNQLQYCKIYNRKLVITT